MQSDFGTSLKVCSSFCKTSDEITFFAFAKYKANIQSTTVWVENAFVEATPFSIPARVKIVASAVLVIEELSTLQTTRVLRPAAFAIFKASKVSAVSPLWEITINSVSFVKRGSLYLNSLAISILHLIFESLSNKYVDVNPAWYEVPQAQILISVIPSIIDFSISSNKISLSLILPSIQSATTVLCS